MSNQYEMYGQDLNLINYFKPCRTLTEVHIPRLAVSRVYVLCMPLTSEKLGLLVLVVMVCTNCPLPVDMLQPKESMFSERCNFLSCINKLSENLG